MQLSGYAEQGAATAGDQGALYAEQVKQLYSNALAGLLGTAINALILGFIQRNVTSRANFIAWAALIAVISLVRYNDIRAFLRRPPDRSEANYWGR